MRIYATVTYRCFTCGEMIVDGEGKADIVNVIFINPEGQEVEPPFDPDVTSHHSFHLEE